MPITGPTGPSSTTPIAAGGGTSAKLGCTAFKNDATLAKIAAGGVAGIARGAPQSESVKTAQVALFSLGFIKDRVSIDGKFGPGTEGSIKAFQAKANVPPTGQLDAQTIRALDKAASTQIAQLKSSALPEGSKHGQYKVVADISDPTKTRLYVVGKNGDVAAKYLTSPGRAEFPTAGDHFVIPDAMVRKPWNPPNSGWAANAKPIPPGVDNPMGIMKLSLGNYSQYIHGIPASEEKDLGHAASHGCLRMSGSNILDLHEKFAEAGTDVTILRDKTKGAALAAKAAQAGVSERPTDAGREYLFGYVSGELGQSAHYGS